MTPDSQDLGDPQETTFLHQVSLSSSVRWGWHYSGPRLFVSEQTTWMHLLNCKVLSRKKNHCSALIQPVYEALCKMWLSHMKHRVLNPLLSRQQLKYDFVNWFWCYKVLLLTTNTKTDLEMRNLLIERAWILWIYEVTLKVKVVVTQSDSLWPHGL